jgi:DNA-binding MarR family transcriptional regulator
MPAPVPTTAPVSEEAEEIAIGLSMRRLLALRYLMTNGATNLTTLAKAIGITSAGMTQMRDSLMSGGLIQDAHSADRRQNPIAATPTGADVYRAAVHIINTRVLV